MGDLCSYYNAQLVEKWTGNVKRLPIPANFPPVIRTRPDVIDDDFDTVLKGIGSAAIGNKFKEALAARGQDSCSLPEEIYIAYPHKYYVADRPDKLRWDATKLAHLLQEQFPETEFKVLNGLMEAKALDRSGKNNANIIHTLSQRQRIFYDVSATMLAPDFLYAEVEQQPWFILIDNSYEYGTTMAEWYSFISSRGGFVCGLVAGHVHISSRFSVTPDLLESLGICLGQVHDCSSEHALQVLENALALHDMSINALTFGEYNLLLQTLVLDGAKNTLGDFVAQLSLNPSYIEKPSPR
jgi:hypothetical protein